MDKQISFAHNKAYGTLYLVPTPIGNLEDFTFRAVKTLGNADLIASEDTRNTQKLLNYFDIETPQKSLHEHNFRERVPQLVSFLQSGKDVAQVSDAGMPSISDPGHELVLACIEAGVPVVALPGPTAGVTALIASGLPAQPFTFYGFLPRKKKEQVAFLETVKEKTETSIYYESPYRLKDTIDVLKEVLGGARQVVVCRELTKIHEEYLRGDLTELSVYLTEHEVKGECCILVAGCSADEAGHAEDELVKLTPEELKQQVVQLVEQGTHPKEAVKEVARVRGLKKQEVYNAYHGIE